MVYLEYGTIEKITLTTSAYTSFHTRLSGLAYVPEFYVLLATHNCEKAFDSGLYTHSGLTLSLSC